MKDDELEVMMQLWEESDYTDISRVDAQAIVATVRKLTAICGAIERLVVEKDHRGQDAGNSSIMSILRRR